MTLKSTGFKCFAKIMGVNFVFCCSSRISFNPSSYFNVYIFIYLIFVKKTACTQLFRVNYMENESEKNILHPSLSPSPARGNSPASLVLVLTGPGDDTFFGEIKVSTYWVFKV